MSIPSSSNYPDKFDTEENLYVVHDSLRLVLSEDYNPGDKKIIIDPNEEIMNRFPPSGLITLTEQLSDIDHRAISFFYSSKTTNSFEGLEILPGFEDVIKPKKFTNVTQNVMAAHHNNLKDALIAIEHFLGLKGTTDKNTLMGRTNRLKKLVFTPRAWFSVNKRSGLVPLTVEFNEQSFRFGDGDVEFLWDFGDADCCPSCTPSTISVTDVVPVDEIGVIVKDLDGGKIVKTYTCPGKFDVKLTVKNEFGEDTIEFKELINARIEAPNDAQIDFIPRTSQNSSLADDPPLFDRLATRELDPDLGAPFTTPPTIRSRTNVFVDMEVPAGNLSPTRSYGGELLDDGGNPIDPISVYTWSLGDDLSHPSLPRARASYSIGGIYDIKLRVDTEVGAYRVTTYENVIDIIEDKNLWLYNFTSGSSIRASEFGLISETFKTATQTQIIDRDDSFLDGTGEEVRAKREFRRNVGFAPRNSGSGDRGTAFMLWAGGGDNVTPIGSQEIKFIEYEGFSDIYLPGPGTTITRPWNWIFLNSGSRIYFAFGPDPSQTPNENISYQKKTSISISPSFVVSDTTIGSGNYLNGADELKSHVTSGFTGGEPETGRFAVYRTTWKDNTGYILRNDGVGLFFRLKSFYKTEGTISDPFINIKKLNDLSGATKVEGQLVTLSSGIFFFNNSGSISAYNEAAGVWETGGPSSSSLAFRTLQDSSIQDFANQSNTLVAATDQDRVVYLSYDYSPNAFIKFNTTDMTFSSLGTRPIGEQFVMGVY
jgi:PKD repeat protein